jgi:hypothetical protein
MHARDSSGRRVSLLNDDCGYHQSAVPQRLSYRTASHTISQPYSSSRSKSSSPNTPELLRSDSYDSQTSNDPISPLTPSMGYDYAQASMYAMYEDYDNAAAKRSGDSPRSNSYDDDASAASPLSERPGKRYPCRFRATHGCEKTFTTSGHASRHSKIHTAEKAVQCTFPGCQKKFTRADNMKQHLETHYKDKSRSSGSHRAASRSNVGALASNSTSRRSSSSGRTSSIASSRSAGEPGSWESDQYGITSKSNHISLLSPSAGAWDMRTLNLPLMGRPSAARTSSHGLDALAAIACQEGA